MSELGDALEAMNTAPRGFDVLLGELTTWRDMDVLRKAMERASGHGGQVLATTLDAVGQPAPERPITKLWFARDGRFRVEQAGTVHVFDGDHRWMRHGPRLTQHPPPKRLTEAMPEAFMIEPRPILGSAALEVVGRGRVAGHDGVVLEGRLWTEDGWGLSVGAGLDWVRVHVDPRTGILLRFETRFEGQDAVRTEFEALAYDAPLAYDPFQMQIGVDERLWTQHDQHAEMLEHFGVDPTGIDLDDMAAVMSAIRSAGRGSPPSVAFPAPVAPLSERFMPVGPPPDDLDAATAAVGSAIEGMTEVDEDGGLPNVQGGSNLGDALAQANRRVNDERGRFEVDDVVFVRADEAVVTFRVVVSMLPGGLSQTGRVVKVDERWKVERGTVCALLVMAGVTCPPPPDEP